MNTKWTLLTAFVVLAWMACAPSFAQVAAADEPEQLVNRFVAAWNTHDAQAFGKLFADDADWVTASGIDLQGRDRIQAFLAEEHASWAKATTMTAERIRMKRMDADSAVVIFHWRIAREGESSGGHARRGSNVFVASRSPQGWIIVAGQVARKAAP
jgi:uncharacterized protein (TIGR02246 family)